MGGLTATLASGLPDAGGPIAGKVRRADNGAMAIGFRSDDVSRARGTGDEGADESAA